MKKSEEFAMEYAQINCDQIQLLIAKAYQEGYEKGVCDSTHKIEIEEHEYFDLGLPSGTLWSYPSNYFDYGRKLQLCSFNEVQDLNLPTKEQWTELCQHCKIIRRQIISPNGIKFGYPNKTYTLGESCKKDHNRFWLKSVPDENHLADVIEFDCDINSFEKHFTGFRLPFFLVRNKNQ